MRQNERGFTLLEIMIALGIFAVVAVLVTMSLEHVRNNQRVLSKNSTQLEQIQLAQMLLEHDFNQMVNRPIAQADGSKAGGLAVNYTGQASIAFTRSGVLNLMQEGRNSNLQRVAYVWDGETLKRQSWQILDRYDDTPDHEQLLLSHVTQFHCSYFDPSGQWVDQLNTDQNNTAIFPRAIKIKFTLSDIGTFERIFNLADLNE